MSMNLFGPYSKTENGNQYMLTVICMLTNYVFLTPIKTKTTEIIINAYLKHVYASFGGSKYIFSDRSGGFPICDYKSSSKNVVPWCSNKPD